MNELGNVNISQEVVATIAESVVSEIEGVNSLVGGTSKNEIVKFFQNVSSGGKGIEVEVGETECTLWQKWDINCLHLLEKFKQK